MGTVLIGGTIVIAIGSFTDALTKIDEFLRARAANFAVSVPELFRVVEDVSLPEAKRLQALSLLRDKYGWTDFRRRTLARLRLPQHGWQGLDLTESDLTGVSWESADLGGCELVRVRLDDADLRSANLNHAALNGSSALRADFTGADLRGAWLRAGVFDGATFVRARLDLAHLEGASYRGATFRGASMTSAHLCDVESGSNLVTHLSDAVLHQCDLRDADLESVTGLSNDQLIGALYNADTKLPPSVIPSEARMMLRE